MRVCYLGATLSLLKGEHAEVVQAAEEIFLIAEP
jgi:hypothetical protein